MNLFFLKRGEWQSSINQRSIASCSNRHERLFGQFYFSDSLWSFIVLISVFYFLCCPLLVLLPSATTQLLSLPPWSPQLAALAPLTLYQQTWASAGCTVSTTSSSLTTKEGKRKTKRKHPREAVYRSCHCQPGEALQKGVFWLRRSSTARLCWQRRNLVQCDHPYLTCKWRALFLGHHGRCTPLWPRQKSLQGHLEFSENRAGPWLITQLKQVWLKLCLRELRQSAVMVAQFL